MVRYRLTNRNTASYQASQIMTAGFWAYVGFGLVSIIPVLAGGAWLGIKSAAREAAERAAKEATERGVKRIVSGQVKDELVNRLDVIAEDRAFINAIFTSGLTREQQMARVRSLLLPAELKRYDAGMKLIELLGDQHVDVKTARPMNLEFVVTMPKASAVPVKKWLQQHSKYHFRVYGSVVDWLFAGGAAPNDIDIAMDNPVRDAGGLAQVIGDSSGMPTRVREATSSIDPTVKSYQVQVKQAGVFRTVCDVHSWDTYTRKMPYGWTTKSAVLIEGVPTERLCEQLIRRGLIMLNPGVGIEGRSRIGPVASQMSWREKDIPRMERVARRLITAARREGKHKVANEAQEALSVLMRKPALGYPATKD